MNKVFLIGRLTNNPQLYSSKNLTNYARTTIAVTRENNREETDFISLIAFSNSASFLTTYFSKGDLVLVEGNISASRYKNDKNEFVDSTNVIIQNIRSLESREITNRRREQNSLNPINTNTFNAEQRPTFAPIQDNNINAEPKKNDDIESPWELDLDID